MLNGLVNLVFNIFFAISRVFVTLIASPLYSLLSGLIPNLNSFLTSFNTFLEDYVFKSLEFMREVFINVTCMPRSLFTAIVSLFFGFIAVGFMIQPILFILNSYGNVKRGVLTK